MEDRIIRKVTEIGNGAHIFAPKEWLDEEVILTRVPRKNPREEIAKILFPYLDKVIAVFLFGSYARNEQEKDSDTDVFVIASEKFSVKSRGMEIMVVPEDKLEAAKEINPVLFYSMTSESLPVINSPYLEKLRHQKIERKYLREFLEETEESISSSREITEMDRKLKSKNASESVIYSLVLRLRGVFIINLLLSGKKYSKKYFADWLIKKSGVDYEKIYRIYRAVRDDKRVEEKVPIEQAQSLLNLLSSETIKLKKKLE